MCLLFSAGLLVVAAGVRPASADGFSFLDPGAENGEFRWSLGEPTPRVELQPVLIETEEELVWGPETGEIEVAPSIAFMGDSFNIGEDVSLTAQVYTGYNVTPIFQVGAAFQYSWLKARDNGGFTQTNTTSMFSFMPTLRTQFVFDKETHWVPYLQFQGVIAYRKVTSESGAALGFGPGAGMRWFVTPKAAIDVQFDYLIIYAEEDYNSIRLMLGAVFLFAT